LSELIKKIMRGGRDDDDDDDSSIVLTNHERKILKKADDLELIPDDGRISPEMLAYSSELIEKTPKAPLAPPAPPAPPVPEISKTVQGAPADFEIPESIKENRTGLFDQISKGAKSLKKTITKEKVNEYGGTVLDTKASSSEIILDKTTSVASSSKVTLDNTKVSQPKTLLKSMSDRLDQINKATIGNDDTIDNND
jgi:hypothetical protein